MSRIVLGNRGSALSLAKARQVLAELTAEWPDVQLTQRTIKVQSDRQDDNNALLQALQDGKIGIAVDSLEHIPYTLPEGVALAAVTKRLEPRYALVGKGHKRLEDVPQGATVGVCNERDRAFLLVTRKDLQGHLLKGNIDEDLALIASGDIEALLMPSAHLIQLERRGRIDTMLEAAVFTPAAGQGAFGLFVREDDNLAYDLAYSLQHRPSFDRVRAERAFAAALNGKANAVGALASVTADGELNLLGAVTDMQGGFLVQAEVSGEASEGADLGRELAQDVLAQLK